MMMMEALAEQQTHTGDQVQRRCAARLGGKPKASPRSPLSPHRSKTNASTVYITIHNRREPYTNAFTPRRCEAMRSFWICEVPS